MRILVATDQWSPDVVGGSARVAADTAHALARLGHEVVVLTLAHRSLAAVEDVGGVEVRRVLRRGPFPQTLADPVISFRHARSLRTRPFDLLVAHQTTNAAGLSAAGLDAPLAFVFHASAVLEMRFLRRRLAGMRRAGLYALDPVLVALERKAVQGATGVLVLSRFSEELLYSRHPQALGRVHVVGGGVDDAFFAEPRDPEACRARLGIPPGLLLFTARRIEPRMGIDVLIEALAVIDDPHVVLAVAGSGTSLDALERRVHELGLDRRVRLLGHVSEDDLRSLYAAADLFVLPTVVYEGFGMSTVEALAAGTPTLGTAVGATPEIVGDLGAEFVAPAADADALAAAIRRLLPLLGPELRARARRLAGDRYSWDAVIVRWERALAEIARR
ncbi:MAG: glycosyltransferase family 4 protein [Actinomycetota bacterium]|nr:glycosyltransferase family 4 protein [Actinomycetota bacterium]